MGKKKNSQSVGSKSDLASSKQESANNEGKHNEEEKVVHQEAKQSKNKKQKKEKQNAIQQDPDEIKRNKKGLLKISWNINAFCALSPFICMWGMVHFNNFSIGSWLFSTMFSFYCLLALLKQCIFPDDFEERVTIIESIFITIINCLYLYPGYQMYSGKANNEPSHERIACSMLLMTFGMFLVMCSDCQKYFTLQAIRMKKAEERDNKEYIEKAEDRPIITEGMFSWTRNPNYLGEIITFSSLCTKYIYFLGIIF